MQQPEQMLKLEDISNYPTDFFAKPEVMPLKTQSQEETRNNNLVMEPQKPALQQTPSFFTPDPVQMMPERQSQELRVAPTREFADLKTDSLQKAQINVNDINSKNKELISLSEKKIKSPERAAERMAPPTIVNNYNGDGGMAGSVQHRDSLENLKMQYRSLPAWRTQIG